MLLNRLLTPALTDFQARSDVMGVILSALLILTGLLWQRIQPVPPEAVILAGEEGLEFAEDLPESVVTELAWASHLLLTNTRNPVGGGLQAGASTDATGGSRA